MQLYKYLLVFIVLFTSCVEKEKKEAETKEDMAVLTPVASPAGAVSSLPYLFTNADKTLLSWVENSGDTLTRLRYSELVDGNWQDPREITEGTDWFVNWADFPVIAENKGNMLSHVLKKSSEGTYSYDVKLNILPEGGTDWATNIPLHTDGTPTEHGFVTALPYTGGSFFVTWLDGRNTAAGEGEHRGAMTIRAAEVKPDGTIEKETVLDDSTCDCCQTTAAITDNGPVVIYRDRSAEEVRDISIVRRVDGEWTAPKTVFADNWQIKGCPVNGPKAAALGNNLVVAWFTVVGEKARVKLAFSEDGGASFDAPIRIDEAKAMGRVDVLLLDKETALVSWMESKDGRALIKAVRVDRSGKKQAAAVIAEMDPSRSSGFPQMELVDDKVYFAWTDVSGENSTVKTAYVFANRL